MNKFFILFVSMALFAEEPIVVKLATTDTLKPLNVSFREKKSPYSKSYLAELKETLLFDLNHNGISQVQEKRALFSVEVTVEGNGLIASIYGSTVAKEINLHLSGELEMDRERLHRFSDTVCEILFGKPGAAKSKILYCMRHGGSSDVWECDYDGKNARAVTKKVGYAVTPRYLPNKQQFIFVGYQSGQSKIYLGSLSSNHIRRLSDLKGNQMTPAISPKGDKVAFVSDVTTIPDLFVQPLTHGMVSGKPQQIFSMSNKTQASPSFSPDSKRIAFTSNIDGSPRVYLMNIPSVGSATKPTLLTKRRSESSAPAWSSDGGKIAYTSLTDGIRQIWVHDLKTKNDKQITFGSGNKENPSWSPNNLQLVYNTSDAGECELYLTNIHGSKPHKISSGVGDKRFPHWSI